MRIYGSRKCKDCRQKYDWAGSLNKQLDEDLQSQILQNRDLHFAKFLMIRKNTYMVSVQCPYCKAKDEFEYKGTLFISK